VVLPWSESGSRLCSRLGSGADDGDIRIFLTFSSHHRWILPPAGRTIVLECCTGGNGTRLNLHGAVVMPDHVRLIFTPLYAGDCVYSVAEIMQGIQSTSAHKVNRLLNRSGQVWQRESFERVLPREESIRAKVEYMIQNPVRSGLVQNAVEYRWLWVPVLAKSVECTGEQSRACLAAA
jgi:hypothetical protein